jgi:hypothetical protein
LVGDNLSDHGVRWTECQALELGCEKARILLESRWNECSVRLHISSWPLLYVIELHQG